MKSVVVIVVSIVVVVIGAIVGITLLFGRGDKGEGGAKSAVSLTAVRRSGTDGGVFTSQDAGVTWRQLARLSERSTLGGVDINEIAPDPQNTATLYLATTGNGLFMSATGTADWVRIHDEKGALTPDTTVHQIAFDRNDSKRAYLAVSQGEIGKVLRSEDGGVTFAEIYQTPKAKSGVFTAVVDPDDSRRIYIGTGEGGLFVSENRGDSWSVVKWFDNPVRRIYMHPQDANFMYFTFLGKDLAKIYRSHDHARTFEELKVMPPKGKRISVVYDIAFHPVDANVLYLATSAGVFKTPDAGATWQEFPLIIPPALLPTYTLAVDPKDPNIIYVSATNQLYKSKDGGASWEVHKLPTARNIRFLLLSPASPHILYAGMRK